jgi:DNA-binding IclR family transcriptional regulator
MADLDPHLHPPVFGLMTQAIMEALCGGAQTLEGLARATGLPSSTLIRTLAVMRDLELIDTRMENNDLRIGPSCP